MAYNPITKQPIGRRNVETFNVYHDATIKRNRQNYLTPKGWVGSDKKKAGSGAVFKYKGIKQRGPLKRILEEDEG